MRNRNRREHAAKRSPHAAHLSQTLGRSRANDHRRRKAVESQSNKSAGISIEPTRYVPNRRSQHQAEENLRKRRQQRKRQ